MKSNADNKQNRSIFKVKNGRVYFSQRTERIVLFYFTVFMLAWGIGAKLNLF